MTREQKARLSLAVQSKIGDLLEFWTESADIFNVEDLDPQEAREVIQGWVNRFRTGDMVDMRIYH